MNEELDPISILVELDGDWQILYKDNGTDNAFLFLLPDNQLLSKEILRNIALNDIIERDSSYVNIIDTFVKHRPNCPFVVKGSTILDCINKMNSKLMNIDYEFHEDSDSIFMREYKLFSSFLEECLEIN